MEKCDHLNRYKNINEEMLKAFSLKSAPRTPFITTPLQH